VSTTGFVAFLLPTFHFLKIPKKTNKKHTKKKNPADEHWGAADPRSFQPRDDVIKKIVSLRQLSAYVDPGSASVLGRGPERARSQLQAMIPTVRHPLPAGHRFLLSPVGASLRLIMRRSDLPDMATPKYRLNFDMDAVELLVAEDQYRCVARRFQSTSMRLFVFIIALIFFYFFFYFFFFTIQYPPSSSPPRREIMRVTDFVFNSELPSKHRHLRPEPRRGEIEPPGPLDAPRAWWRYAIGAVLADVRDARERWTWPYMRQRALDRCVLAFIG
jgi:hypothetical protein